MVAVATFQVPDTYTCAPDTWTQGMPIIPEGSAEQLGSGRRGYATWWATFTVGLRRILLDY